MHTLRIKNGNVPPKFVVPIENTTLKDHNLYKNGLENIKLYGTYGNKEIHNYAIDINN
jgi:hypothetical protein